MKRFFSLFVVLSFLLLITPAFSINEPSQQSNKIYYAPYYVASMSQNVNSTFNLPINPPDGIYEVKSAVINFQVYAAPTITFTLYANNKSCNPASFSIATTYASAGLLSFAFDCSNVIKSAGNYTLKLSPSKNTGAAYGWMDFGYINNPNGRAEVKGTEYFAGDKGTVFLQLVDAYGQPINTAACFTDIYFPSSYDLNHTAFVEDIPMLYKEEGLYYYDFTVPPYTGVYMVLANCRYGHSVTYWYMDTQHQLGISSVTAYSGDTAVLNDFSDSQYIKFEQSDAAIDVNFTVNNITSTNNSVIMWKQFFQTEDLGTITGQMWNWTSGRWVPIFTITTQGTAGGTPVQYDEYEGRTTTYNPNYLRNGTVKLRLNSTDTKKVYLNALWLDFFNYDPQYVPIYGSGELHISSQGDTPLIVTTLCGDSTSNCAVFYQNNTNYPYPEGSIYDNVTVFAQQSGPTYWTYTTPNTVDCSAINRIAVKNSTNGTWNNLLFSEFSQQTTSAKNCIVNIPLNATRGQTYYYFLDYGNYMKYTVLDDWRAINKINSTMSFTCDSVALANNWTFIVPIPSNMTLPTGNQEQNVTLALCSRLKDGIYWAGYFYNQSFSISTSGVYQQYLTELEYYYEKLFRGGSSLLQINTINLLQNVNNTITTNIAEQITNTNATLHSALARNFTLIHGNLSLVQASQNLILGNQTIIQNNQASLNSTLLSINSSLSAQLTNLLSAIQSTNTTLQNALYQNGSSLLSAIYNVNSTLNSALVNNFTLINANIVSTNTTINNALSAGFTNTNGMIVYANNSVHGALFSNFTNTNLLINAIGTDLTSVNLTIHSALANNFSAVRADIASVNGTMNLVLFGNFSNTNALINAINTSLYNSMQNINVNLTPVLNNQALILANQTILNGNIQSVNNTLLGVNTSLYGQVVSLYALMNAVNSSIYGQEGIILNAVYAVQSDVQNTNSTLHSSLAQNTSGILSAIQNTNSTLVNLLTGLASYFDGLFNLNSQNMQNNFTYTNSLIQTQNLTCGNVTVNAPTVGAIANAVWTNPTRTLTEWNTVISAIWDSNKNTCKATAPPPSETVGNTPKEPANFKIGNTESGSSCGFGCRINGAITGIFGGG